MEWKWKISPVISSHNATEAANCPLSLHRPGKFASTMSGALGNHLNSVRLTLARTVGCRSSGTQRRLGASPFLLQLPKRCRLPTRQRRGKPRLCGRSKRRRSSQSAGHALFVPVYSSGRQQVGHSVERRLATVKSLTEF